ncbi:MAG: chemotaxis protein CheA [Jannaschia sp.]
MDEIRATFFEECGERLEQLEAGLLVLQDGDGTGDTIDALFRAVHSIKGGAAAFDLGTLVAFTHDFETALDGLRTGLLAPVPDIVLLLLRSCDRLGDLIAMARVGETGDEPIPPDLVALAARVSQAHHDDRPDVDDAFDLMPDIDPMPLDQGARPPECSVPSPPARPPSLQNRAGTTSLGSDGRVPVNRPTIWTITVKPLEDLLASGNEPLFLFRALQVLGALTVVIRDDALPALDRLDAAVPSVWWDLTLRPTADDVTRTEIEAVFEFVADLCELTIAPSVAPGLHDTPVPSGRMPAGADDPHRVSAPISVPGAPAAMAVAQPSVRAARPSDAETEASPGATIRVELDRIDRLVNLVGELVISQSMLAQSLLRDRSASNATSASCLEDLQQLTRNIQDSVMAIRAQPVRSLFQRMTRIVRETALMTGKDVRLETSGEGTEIDKTVVERLADPLTHMIRNAIDHGLEHPEDRIAAGKTRTGTVRLSARQQSDRVIIEVADDGRGIDRARVLERAVDRSLVPPDLPLETAQIDRLIFRPGFSTRDEISALSGRGVGMDVVQRAIHDLNGTISLSSESGRGCAITISLPLTLAILDGMIVRTARHRLVMPLSAIIETQTLSSATLERLGPGRDMVRFHDRFVPVVDLGPGMGFGADARHDAPPDDDDAARLVLRPDDLGVLAVRVDAIEAQRQVVIKGLGSSFGRIPGVSAATILGDGQVALIVDPSGLALNARRTSQVGPAQRTACVS